MKAAYHRLKKSDKTLDFHSFAGNRGDTLLYMV